MFKVVGLLFGNAAAAGLVISFGPIPGAPGAAQAFLLGLGFGGLGILIGAVADRP